MSNFDKDRYASLIARASFDMSAYKGTYQDQSKNRLAMSAVGTPTWWMVNGLPCLRRAAAGDYVASAVVPSIVDLTGAFSVELLCSVHIEGYPNILAQYFGAVVGGFFAYPDCRAGAERFYLEGYSAAGALARSIRTAVGTVAVRRVNHIIAASTLGMTAGQIWVNGVAMATTVVGAGVVANPADSIVRVLGGGTGTPAAMIARAYPFALTNEDVATLYASAKLLTGGEV